MLKLAEQKKARPGLTPEQVTPVSLLLVAALFSVSHQITEEFGKKVKTLEKEWGTGRGILGAWLYVHNPDEPVRQVQLPFHFIEKDPEAPSGERMFFSTAAST